MRLSMRWISVFLLAAALAGAERTDKAAGSLRHRVESVLRVSKAAQRSFWGVYVVDAATGKPLVAINQGRLFTPASNLKLFTTALALARLGPQYRFETTITSERGPDASGHVAGNLRLVGGGDPSLSARAVPYQKGPVNGDPLEPIGALADQVVAAGVKRIDGDIVGDDTRYAWEPYPEGWAQDDTLWDYGAPVSALSVNDSMMWVRLRPDGDRGAVTLSPPLEYFTIDNRVRAGVGLENVVHVERLPGSRQLRLWGTLALNRPVETQLAIAADDPALYAAYALADALTRRGVVIQGRPRALHRYVNQIDADMDAPGAKVLARRQSPPLIELAQIVDKVSQNQHAEMMLREVARVRRGKGTLSDGLDEMREFLAGAGITQDEFHFVDGSGLSSSDLVAPEAVVKLLQFMYRSEQREAWISLLPVGAEDGTLSTRFGGRLTARRIHAKTGSLTSAAALSGYAESPARGTLIFSILANNYSGPGGEMQKVIDRIALALAE
jgi:D-alanyl-D-alanine carboxypeptidase/D-alanyl-D-alanine-endopeptidase (penicillin-binding protein 4)